MIILDTSILRSFGPQSSIADLLRTISVVGLDRIGAPWMVLEELAAQQAIKYEEQHQRAADALDALRHAAPWHNLNVELGPAQPEQAREHWRSTWGNLVEVIPTSEKALRQALFREANLLAPCRESKNQKTGARDAAIWLSAVEYARKNPTERVYFVSANTKDFGDGSSFPYPMNEDIAGLADRFTLMTSMDDVAARFTEPADADPRLVEEILVSEDIWEYITTVSGLLARLSSPVVNFSVPTLDGSAASATADRWVTTRVHLDLIEDVQAYRIGTQVWCTASVDWNLVGMADSHLFGVVAGALCWPTVILFRLDPANAHPTLLRSHVPRPVSADVLRKLDVAPADATSVEAETLAARAAITRTLRPRRSRRRLHSYPQQSTLFRPEPFPTLDDMGDE
ncbi:PIN domain-containing protein [Streptomyces sp. TE5632]